MNEWMKDLYFLSEDFAWTPPISLYVSLLLSFANYSNAGDQKIEMGKPDTTNI